MRTHAGDIFFAAIYVLQVQAACRTNHVRALPQEVNGDGTGSRMNEAAGGMFGLWQHDSG